MGFSRRSVLAFGGALPLFLAARAALGASASPEPSDAAVRRLADLLDVYYPDEALARRAHDLLLANLAAGAYRALDPKLLAARLDEEISTLTRDEHFSVRYDGPDAKILALPDWYVERLPPGTPPQREVPRPAPPDYMPVSRAANHGVAGARILPGNVGLIDLRYFHLYGPELEAAYAAAFRTVADTDALVIDLTQHGGGDPLTVAYAVSYFTDGKPLLVNRIHWRARGTREFWTFTALEGPRYGTERPVFLATSSKTFSGAEDFAYNLKHRKRATLVGERTRGGANPGGRMDIGAGFSAFIPMGRAENPVMGTNWEGVGIEPDVRVPAGEAVATAHRLAREVLANRRRTD